MARNNDFRAKTKHIHAWERFITNMVERGLCFISYVSTTHMIANALTKALSQELHEKHVHAMGLSFDQYHLIKCHTCSTTFSSCNKLYAHMRVEKHFKEETPGITTLLSILGETFTSNEEPPIGEKRLFESIKHFMF